MLFYKDPLYCTNHRIQKLYNRYPIYNENIKYSIIIEKCKYNIISMLSVKNFKIKVFGNFAIYVINYVNAID